MAELADRITVDAEQCGGRPCVRGMRIRVTDVLDLLAAGLSRQQVLEELPDLEPDDITACLRFASRPSITRLWLREPLARRSTFAVTGRLVCLQFFRPMHGCS